MTEPSTRQRSRRPHPGPLNRLMWPSLFVSLLIALLAYMAFFVNFDWQWKSFLAGIVFASVLALIGVVWKSGRRSADAVHYQQRLDAEIAQHRGTREQLERELALHQQDRTRLAKESEAHRLVIASKQAAESRLAMLKLHLEEIAVFVDGDQHCGFHTRRFAAWTGLPSGRIDGLALDEALSARDAGALRTHLLDALEGREGRAELSLQRRSGVERVVVVDFLPQRDAAGEVCGTLLLIHDPQSAADAASTPVEAAPQEDDSSAAEETQHGGTKLLISDESGNAVYLSSLTEELSGWGNPRERIRQAIKNDGFDLYAQNIVALDAGAPLKTMRELLIRMRDEEQNMVPPGTFLPIAEQFNMMPDIDRFVVRKAIAAHAAGAAVLCINLARSTIEDGAFAGFVARALAQSGVPGQALCFEIADGDAIACLPDAVRLAHELKPLGCQFTLDGFGRAGVGFEHVKALPLDFLKIDGSIILQILRVPEALAKVRAIQRVSKVIGLCTIAEMVENAESQERLRAVGVDYAQGFGIATPRPFSHDSN